MQRHIPLWGHSRKSEPLVDVVLAGVLCLLLAGGGAWAASLEFAKPRAENGLLVLPLVLDAGADEEVASLQFEVNIDESVYAIEEVAPGAVATAAGKDTMYTTRRRGARVIVAGLNQTRMDGGEVAVLYLRPLLEDTDSAVGISELLFADPAGNRIETAVEPEPEPEDKTGGETQEETEEEPEDTAPEDTAAQEAANTHGESESDGASPTASGGTLGGGGLAYPYTRANNDLAAGQPNASSSGDTSRIGPSANRGAARAAGGYITNPAPPHVRSAASASAHVPSPPSSYVPSAANRAKAPASRGQAQPRSSARSFAAGHDKAAGGPVQAGTASPEPMKIAMLPGEHAAVWNAAGDTLPVASPTRTSGNRGQWTGGWSYAYLVLLAVIPGLFLFWAVFVRRGRGAARRGGGGQA